jgi:hypothetical protein
MKAVLERAAEALVGVPRRRGGPSRGDKRVHEAPSRLCSDVPRDGRPSCGGGPRVRRVPRPPELFDRKAVRLEEEYGLNREFAGLMASSPSCQLFEEAVRSLSLHQPWW